MIYEFFTGKKVTDLNKCDMCKYNVGYSVKDKTMIWCDKDQKYVRNDKSRCEDNVFTLREKEGVKDEHKEEM